MARKVTLFTGQWADLPLEKLAKMAKSFGYDGLELACWGDHFDPNRGAVDIKYCEDKKKLLKKYGLECWALSNHLAGQLVCDHNDDERSDAFAPPELAGNPEYKKGHFKISSLFITVVLIFRLMLHRIVEISLFH